MGYTVIAKKLIFLGLLVVQTVASIFFTRLSRIKPSIDGFDYLSTTSVFMAEIFKLVASTFLLWFESPNMLYDLKLMFSDSDTLLICIPALLYTVQNNLLYIGMTNLSLAFYQLLYQLKVLITAGLSVLLLKRVLGVSRWISMVVLALGVALVQLSINDSKNVQIIGKPAIGVFAVVGASFTSSFAGVYLEKLIKRSNPSIWLRNIQLSAYGIVLSIIGVFFNDRAAIAAHGFFQGYTFYTWMSIILHGLGGLIVASVLKYSSNIEKCFGNALAIVFSCLISYFVLKDISLTFCFLLGTALIKFSVFAYGTNLSLWNYLQKLSHLCSSWLKRDERSLVYPSNTLGL